MKTPIYLIALFSLYTVHCAEQFPADLLPIFNRIKHEIETADRQSPAWDLEIFLQSEKAILLKKELKDSSQGDKNKLIEKIYDIWGGDRIWPQIRDFIAAIIEAGGYIDTPLSVGTFLGKSTLYSDKKAVIFALENKADTCLTYGSACILQRAKTYSLVSLLLEHKNNNDASSNNHNALSPLRSNLDQQFDLLDLCTYRNNYSPKLLKLYRQNGLSLTLCNSNNWTLFHSLCSGAADHQPQAFFEKFLILFKSGAIDLKARNNNGETGLDLLKKHYCQKDPTLKLAEALIEGLRENPMLQMPRYKVIEAKQTGKPNASADATSKKRSHAEAFGDKV